MSSSESISDSSSVTSDSSSSSVPTEKSEKFESLNPQVKELFTADLTPKSRSRNDSSNFDTSIHNTIGFNKDVNKKGDAFLDEFDPLEEFDFKGNLKLFNKKHFYNNVDSAPDSDRPDSKDIDRENKIRSKMYKHTENVLRQRSQTLGIGDERFKLIFVPN